LIAPAPAQFHEKHYVDIPRYGRSYSKKVVSQEGENEKPPESTVQPHCKLIQAKSKGKIWHFLLQQVWLLIKLYCLSTDKGTKETQQEFICSKTAEPNINIVNALKRSSSQKLSNIRPILKRNLQSNISDNSRQETEFSDGNSGDGQDFGFDFQEDPSVEDEIDLENYSDIALAGSGDTEEYEIPDWALKPM
jgi:hypothetical protein